MTVPVNRRILVVDDNQAIQMDYRKILTGSLASPDSELADLESDLFGDVLDVQTTTPGVEPYEITTASQGLEALELVTEACNEGRPFALVFMDVRMPPGWDGIQTIEKLWEVDKDLQAVICTAYSDYSWSETVGRLGQTDRLLILKKPFDSIEVCQLASAMVEKWNMLQRERHSLELARAAEREARAYAASLETVNRALETTLATAEESARAKSQFLMHVTHELLEPIAGLLGKAQELKPCESVVPEWLSTIEQVCRDGSALRLLLGDIVDLSDIEANQFRLENSVWSPLEAAQEVVEQCRERASSHGVTLSVGCVSPIPSTIATDRKRFQRLLYIVLENGIRRSPRGEEVRLRLGLERTASWQEPLLRLEIRDRGAAISRRESGLLFEPFQAKGRLSLELGLAKRLAHLLGGDLLADSSTLGFTSFGLTVRTGVLDGVSLFEPSEGQA